MIDWDNFNFEEFCEFISNTPAEYEHHSEFSKLSHKVDQWIIKKSGIDIDNVSMIKIYDLRDKLVSILMDLKIEEK